jgi:hypothetical protein
VTFAGTEAREKIKKGNILEFVINTSINQLSWQFYLRELFLFSLISLAYPWPKKKIVQPTIMFNIGNVIDLRLLIISIIK